MPRIPRMVINDEATVYHVMSRTALDEFWVMLKKILCWI